MAQNKNARFTLTAISTHLRGAASVDCDNCMFCVTSPDETLAVL
ncbi:hypothetical protein SK224_05275 [Microbacterium sp. BG28]|nr:hypothetical protein [Microbacterium sp. BG28]MDY0828536.1 hypothetical protein [Microbacterium sp. BG28]